MDELIVEQIEFVEEIPEYLRSFVEVNWNLENLKKFVSSTQNILIVARKGENGCGMIRAHFLPRYDDKNPEIILHEIDVLPNFQKQGIATALINKLKEIAKDSSASEMWVLTNKSNEAAVALYEKTGGKKTHDDDIVFIYEKEQF